MFQQTCAANGDGRLPSISAAAVAAMQYKVTNVCYSKRSNTVSSPSVSHSFSPSQSPSVVPESLSLPLPSSCPFTKFLGRTDGLIKEGRAFFRPTYEAGGLPPSLLVLLCPCEECKSSEEEEEEEEEVAFADGRAAH